MRPVHVKVLLASLVLTSLSVPIEARADDGVWVEEPDFSQANVACFRTYVCRPATDILHGDDTVVKMSDPKIVWGVCSAGDGPVDSCHVCLTNAPSEQCPWELLPK